MTTLEVNHVKYSQGNNIESWQYPFHFKRIFRWKSFTQSKQTNQKIVISCFLGGPRNSSLNRCSRIHTTAPTKRKKAPVTHHIWAVNGLRKDQGLDFSSLTGTTTTSPDSMYGWVKSTSLVLFVTIVTSPTAASKSWGSKWQYWSNYQSSKVSTRG